MTNAYSYKEAVKKANEVYKNVKAKQVLGCSEKQAWVFSNALLNPGKATPKQAIATPDKKYLGDYFSQQIGKGKYLDCAKRFIESVKRNNKMPLYISYNNKKIHPKLFCFLMAKALIEYDKNGEYKSSLNLSSKVFKAETETSSNVMDLWKSKFGKPSSIDDVMDIIASKFHYEYYYDSKKTARETINDKGGNCTDLSQMLSILADDLGYTWKCIHTECAQSGAGHVYLKLKKNNGWFSRDPACASDSGNMTCIWCNVDTGAGRLLAENPSWWLDDRMK